MALTPELGQPMQRAHWGWFIASWIVTMGITAYSSFAVLVALIRGSVDSPNGSPGGIILIAVAAVVIASVVFGIFMHRSLRHNALWPRIIILLALLGLVYFVSVF